MDPTTILLAALAVAGYFFFRDDKKKKGDHDADDSKNGDDEDGGEAAEPPPMSYAPVPMPRMPSPRPAPAPVAPASASLTAAARALVAALQQRAPCDAVSGAMSSFQQMALSEGRGLGPSGADGEYGPTTQRVLSAVLRQPAPPAVWGPGGRCHGAPAAPSGGGPSWDSSDSGPGSARPLLDTMNAMIADGDNASDARRGRARVQEGGDVRGAAARAGHRRPVEGQGQAADAASLGGQWTAPVGAIRLAIASQYAHLRGLARPADGRRSPTRCARAKIVTSHMRDTYRRALDQFTTSGFTTGIGT